MKKLLIALVLSLTVFVGRAQECGTEPAPQYILDALERLNLPALVAARTEDDTIIYVPIQMHMIRSDAGTAALSEADLFTAICTMNVRYNDAKIQFYITDQIFYYNNSTILNASDGNSISTLMSANNKPYVMNIYFTNLGQRGLNGYAWYPNSGPGTGVRQGGAVMSYSAVMNGATLSHETGHYLSLPHPFDGTSNNPLMGERVTRNFNETPPRLPANCYNAGDRFCDTKADKRGARWGCTYAPAAADTDLNGDFFWPDSSLLMSYAGDACRIRLTDEQMAACRSTLQTPNDRGYLTFLPRPVQPSINTAPVLTLPANGATGLHPNFTTFAWDPVPGATIYRLRALSNGVVVDLDTIIRGGATSYFHGHNKLKANRSYQWEVTAYNETDFCGNPTSARGTFQTTTFTATSVDEAFFADLSVFPTLLERHGVVQLQGESLNGKSLQVELRSMTGQLLRSESLQIDGDAHFHTELSNSGVYFLTLRHEGYRIVRKLVVQ